MRRHCIALAAWTVAAGLAGCGVTEDARRLVAKAPTGGLAMTFYPTAEKMKQRGRIDEHHVIPGAESTPIDVWVLRAKGGRPKATVLLLHARDENKSSFPTIGAGERLAAKGYDVILPDLRGHGRSGGQYITYGVKEAADLKAVMDALVPADAEIYVFGRNYSGLVAVKYAAVDPRVRGLLAVAPYASFREIARHWYPLADPETFEEILSGAADLADFDPAEASAVEAAGRTDATLVIVHGLLDASAPRAHGEKIARAAGKRGRLVVPVAGEALAIGIMEDWVANRMAELASGKALDLPELKE